MDQTGIPMYVRHQQNNKFNRKFGPWRFVRKPIKRPKKTMALFVPEHVAQTESPLGFNDWNNDPKYMEITTIIQSFWQLLLAIVEQWDLGTPLLKYDKFKDIDTLTSLNQFLRDNNGRPKQYNYTIYKPEGSYLFDKRTATHLKDLYNHGQFNGLSDDNDDNSTNNSANNDGSNNASNNVSSNASNNASSNASNNTDNNASSNASNNASDNTSDNASTNVSNNANNNVSNNANNNANNNASNNNSSVSNLMSNNTGTTAGNLNNEIQVQAESVSNQISEHDVNSLPTTISGRIDFYAVPQNNNSTPSVAPNSHINTGISPFSLLEQAQAAENAVTTVLQSINNGTAAARSSKYTYREQIEEKFKIVVVPMYYTKDRDPQERYAGFMIFFFQMDPNFNTGEAVDNLCVNRLKHRQKKCVAHIKDRYVGLETDDLKHHITPELYVDLATLYRTGYHSALKTENSNSPENQLSMELSNSDDGTDEEEDSDTQQQWDMMYEAAGLNDDNEENNDHMDFDNYNDDGEETDLRQEQRHSTFSFSKQNHPYHPTNVCNVMLAVDWAIAHGVNTDSLMASLTTDNDSEIWSFSTESAYTIPMGKFFWRRNDQDGLNACYLPWVRDPFAEFDQNGQTSRSQNHPRRKKRTNLEASLRRSRRENAARALELSSLMKSRKLLRYGSNFNANSLNLPPEAQMNWIIALKMRTQNKYDSIINLASQEHLVDFTKSKEVEKYNKFVSALESYEKSVGTFFQNEIWTTHSVIPVALSAIVDFHRNNASFTKVGTMFHLNDIKMDHFGNFMTTLGLISRFDRLIATCTRDWIITHYGSKDSYRPGYTLHFHWLATGPGGCSKSVVLDELVANSIPGSINDLIDGSNRSENTDEDQSDSTTVYDEAPLYFVNSKESANNSMAQRQKSKLSSMRLKMRVFEYFEAEGGRKVRTSRIVITNAIGCIFMATNFPHKDMGPAMATRFHRSIFVHWSIKNYGTPSSLTGTKRNRKNESNLPNNIDSSSSVAQNDGENTHFDVTNTQDNDSNGSDDDGNNGSDYENDAVSCDFPKNPTGNLPKASVVHMHAVNWSNAELLRHEDQRKFFQIRQFLQAYINKLIQVNVLPEPNMDACHYVVDCVLTYMSTHGKIKVSSYRSYQRILAMARVFTIENAINMVFCSPGALYYGQDFHESQVLALKPYLCCSVQIAIFVFTLLSDEYINPVKDQILKTAISLTGYDVAKREKSKINGAASENPEDTYLLDTNRRIQWKLVGKEETTNIRAQQIDLNYVMLSGSLYDVAHAIRSNMSPAASIEDIVSVLTELKDRVIRVDTARELIPQTQIATNAEIPCSSKNLNVVASTLNPSTRQKEWYFCIYALDTVVSDQLMKNAILSIFYREMRPRRLILGLMKDAHRGKFEHLEFNAEKCIMSGVKIENHLNILSAAHMTENERKTLYFNGGNFDPDKETMEDYLTAWEAIDACLQSHRKEQYTVIREDLDDWVFRRHCEKSGVRMEIDYSENILGVLKWVFSDARTGKKRLLDIPTPHAEQQRMLRFIRSHPLLLEKHIKMYENSEDILESVTPLDLNNYHATVQPSHCIDISDSENDNCEDTLPTRKRKKRFLKIINDE